MLTVAGLSKAFGGRQLFDDVSLTLQSGERVGLVGPNGAGKSTLLKIILGHESPDAGEVTFIRGTRFGYLPQESEPAGNEIVLDIAVPHDHEHDGQFVAKAKQILASLGFKQSDFTRPARELSGGWVMRAHLARLLTQEPDVLMLDEPTNHLDLETLLWFQDYLRNYPGAILLISHDREFLNRLCTHVAEIRSSRVLRYTGNYDEYLEQRAATEVTLVATAKAQQREIDRMQLFVDRFRAKNTKAAQAQSKMKQIERLKEDMVETPDGSGPTVGFRFPQPQRSGHRSITLKHVKFGYGVAATPSSPDSGAETSPSPSGDEASPPPKLIYENLNFEAERGQRIVLVGPNGAGKSTLLKLLAGVLQPQAGERKLGHNAKSGYFAQHRAAMLNPKHTVLQEALETPQRVTEQAVRTVLGSFLFRGDDVFKPVSVLSGGEKSRLALVKLLLDPPNLLLMDEPTTHLDLASVDALIEALRPFEGTLIFISHDVHFIRTLANHVVRVEDGRLRHFTGGYQYYLDKTSQSARVALTSSGRDGMLPSQNSRTAASHPSLDRKEQRRAEAGHRQARSRKRQEIQKRIAGLEKEIAELESREKELTAELEKPETYATGGRATQINRELMEVHARLAESNTEWEAAGTELAEFERE